MSHLLIIFQLVIGQSCKLVEKASQDKEEVFVGGWSGVPTPSTTANKNLFFIIWSFLYKLKVWSVNSWRQTAMSMMLNERREAMKEAWGLRLTLTPLKRCYASGQHLLPHNKLCCQIWSKEGNHEGDHWGWLHKGGATPQGNICSHSTNYVVKFWPRRETMKVFDSSRHIYWSFFN